MPDAHSIPPGAVVYFIQVGDDGPIKIGCTAGSPLVRLQVLQTASPHELRLIGAKWVTRLLTEAVVHARFEHLRIRGEWFSSDSELLEFIADVHGNWEGPKPKVPGPCPKTEPRPCVSDVHAIEARVIAAAKRGDPSLNWREIAAALKLRKSTYFDRCNLPAEVKAAREAPEAACSGGCLP
jgi:hypothetical protein